MQRNLFYMYAIALLQGMVFYGPVATLYRQAQGVSITQVALIESISLALCIILEIPWGVLADKLGYRTVLVFCCFLYFFSKIVFWQASGFGGFLLERIILSIALSGISGVDTSILYLSRGKADSQHIFSLYNSLQTAGLLIASITFSLLIQDNYALAGQLTVLSYGAAALFSLGLTPVSCPHCFSPLQTVTLLKQTLRNKSLLLFLCSVALLTEAHQTITVFLNQLQYEICGLPDTIIGGLYIAATLLGLTGIASARLTRRTGFIPAAFLFYGGAAIACAVLALSHTALPSVCAILALRLCNTLFQPLQMTLQNRQVSAQHRATALSIYAMVTDSVGIGINLTFGVLAGASLSLAFWFGSSICLTGLVLFLLWHRFQTHR